MPVLILAILLITQIQAPAGVVSGRIQSADGKPSAGLRVSAMLAPDSGRSGDADVGALFSQTQTDEAGRYRLENIPPGRYYIMAGRVDAPTYYPGRTDQLAASAISVASGAPIEGIDFTVSDVSTSIPPGSTGFVITPILNVSITVNLRAESGSRVPIMSPNGRTQIVANGVSGTPVKASSVIGPDGSFSWMAPSGEYRFSIESLPDDYEVKSMSSGSVDLLRETLRLTGPAAVEVHATLGLKNPLPPRQGRVIRGQIFDAITARPWIGEAVYLSGRPGTVFSDGSFEFFGVPAGGHALQAREGLPGNRTAEGKVVVGNTDVTTGLTYTSIPASVRIAGRVVVEGGNAPARLNAGRILATAADTNRVAVAADGTFKTALPEGEYQLSIDGFPPGLSLKSISSGNVDLLAEPLRVQPRNGPAMSNVVVILAATPRFRVRGRVIADPPTRPVEDAVVTLNGGPERYTTKAAADGTFEVLSVLPGQYQIAIQPFGFSNVNGTVVVANQDVNLEFKSQPLY
jgi:hypothetical protein